MPLGWYVPCTLHLPCQYFWNGYCMSLTSFRMTASTMPVKWHGSLRQLLARLLHDPGGTGYLGQKGPNWHRICRVGGSNAWSAVPSIQSDTHCHNLKPGPTSSTFSSLLLDYRILTNELKYCIDKYDQYWYSRTRVLIYVYQY